MHEKSKPFTDVGWVLIKLRYVLCNQVKCNFQSDLVCLFYVFNSMLTSQYTRCLYLPFPYFITPLWLSSQFGVFFKHEEKKQVCSNFASFFFVMAHNSSVNVKPLNFPLPIKGSHQSPNFVTFKCSNEKLPYFSCHFLNHKSVFLQILYHSLVS